MRNNLTFALLFIYCFSLAVSCNQLQQPDIGCNKKKNKHIKKSTSINFLVIGDWGRDGTENQKDVAKQMGIDAGNKNAAFVISTGDNFYGNGVSSITDPQWKTSFEDIYTDCNLMIPWYAVLGNHDYHKSVQAEIDYGKLSNRWRMPDRYYSFERQIPNSEKTALFVFLDTSPFDGGLNRADHSDLAKQDTTMQKVWLEKTLATSKADWKIVIGHHPLYTTGVRRDKMLDVRASLLPLFKKHAVNAYFAGHEHDLQHQKPEGYTHYFVSGAGSQLRPVTSMPIQTKFAISDHGFMSVQIKKDSLYLQAINYLGSVLYKTSIGK